MAKNVKEAAQILIGAALTGGPVLDFLEDGGGIPSKVFEERAPSIIWGVARDYYRRFGGLPDLDILESWMEEHGTKNSAATLAYARRAINELETDDLDGSKLEFYVQQLSSHHDSQHFMRTIEKGMNAFENGGHEDAREIILRNLEETTEVGSTVRTVDLVKDFEDFEADVQHRRENPEESNAIPLGIQPLDDVLQGGLMGGELFLLAAVPSGGKSVGLIDIAISSAMTGRKAHFFTIEMGAVQTAFRGYSRISEISTKKFRHAPNMTDDDFEKWKTSLEKLRTAQQMGVKITSIPDQASTRHMRSELSRLHRKEGWRPDIILVDYAGIMRPADAGAYKHEADWAFVGQNVRDLKTWAISDNVPVVSAVQLLPDAIGKDTLSYKDIGMAKLLISAHSDIIAGIIPLTPEELEFLEVLKIRLQWLKVREGAVDDKGDRINFTDLHPDFAKMRIHSEGPGF